MIYHYYLSANSAQGHIDWTEQRAKQLEHVIWTAGYPGALMRVVAGSAMTLAREQGLRLDIIHRPLDGDITGLIVPERSSAVFNTPLWLDKSRNISCLYEDATRDEIQMLLGEVYNDYAAAKLVHDDWEKIYIGETDFAKLDALSEAFSEMLTGGRKSERSGKRTDAFFGAATPDGPVDYIACLSADLSKRYFMKGRPGTGKSTFLKKAADAAQLAGFDIEVYHCSFDTNSLDMLIAREQGICIFDSTAPHEYFPTKAGDEIIDLYAGSVRSGTDERSAAQIGKIAKEYKRLTGRAANRMGHIREILSIYEAESTERLDAERVAIEAERLISALFER